MIFGLAVCAVVSDDLVSLKDVAMRTDRTYEAARLWASGKRGYGAEVLADEPSPELAV
jgi:hypothetical protein